MEGKLIRKYREIFSRIPQSNHTIKDILRFLDDDIIIERDNEQIVIPYKNLLEKITCIDWLRSRGVRQTDILVNENNTIVCDVSFCSHFQCVIEYVSFLRDNHIDKEFFSKSMYSTEHSRGIRTEKKYKCYR